MDELTIRSRTLLFLSIRASSVHRPLRSARQSYDPEAYQDNLEESRGLLADTHTSPRHTNEPLLALPPKWVDISTQVQNTLAQTRMKIATLDKLHAKHVLPGFADRSAEEREIERMTSDITRDFRQCQSLIQQINPSSTPSQTSHSFPPKPPTGPSRHEILTAQNVQRGLAAKVQDLSGAFRKKQKVYMQKLQGHAIKNQDLLIASGAISLKGSDSISAVEEDVEASRSQLSKQKQKLQQQSQLQPEIETRTREVTEIAKSIASLAELFKDLSSLVIDQGTILDSVEYNIEQTSIHVQEAVKELDVATKYQKNTGRRSCIFLLLLIIFGLILVLIFKPRRNDSSSVIPTPPGQTPETPSGSAVASVLLAARRRYPPSKSSARSGLKIRDYGRMFALR